MRTILFMTIMLWGTCIIAQNKERKSLIVVPDELKEDNSRTQKIYEEDMYVHNRLPLIDRNRNETNEINDNNIRKNKLNSRTSKVDTDKTEITRSKVKHNNSNIVASPANAPKTIPASTKEGSIRIKEKRGINTTTNSK